MLVLFISPAQSIFQGRKSQSFSNPTRIIAFYPSIHCWICSPWMKSYQLWPFTAQIIKPLAWHYTGWALKNLARDTTKDQEDLELLNSYKTGWAPDNLAEETIKDLENHEPLSRTEEAWLLRALCPFQLYYNLFGVRRFDRQRRLELENVDILRIFMGIYEP